MSSNPSLRPLYTFFGWVIKEVKLNSELAIVRLRRNKKYKINCPFCSKQARENRRIWQGAKDLPLGSAKLVEIIYDRPRKYYPKNSFFLDTLQFVTIT